MFVSNITSRADKALKYFDSSAIKTTCAKIYLDKSVDEGKVSLPFGVRGRKSKAFRFEIKSKTGKNKFQFASPHHKFMHAEIIKSREYGLVACCSLLGILSQKHRIIPQPESYLEI